MNDSIQEGQGRGKECDGKAACFCSTCCSWFSVRGSSSSQQDLKALREHKQQRYRRKACMSVQRGVFWFWYHSHQLMAETAPQESEESHSLKLAGGLGFLTPDWKEISWLKSKTPELSVKRNDDWHLEVARWMPQDWIYNILFLIIVMMTWKLPWSHYSALVINEVTL